MTVALENVTRKLGLLQTAGKDAARRWAHRTRELQAQHSHSADQAAITAAIEVFPSEFQPTRYKYQDPPIEELLGAIERL